MTRLPQLRQRRAEILRHIGSLEKMRRGSVTHQFHKLRRPGSSTPVFSGPYPLFTCKKDGRTVARRLRDPEEIRRLEEQVENYHAFRRLCSQLVDVSEAICDEELD
jgi:hypothetical protein